MNGFSIPKINIPKINIPNISIGGGSIDTGAIESAISSALPDISSITNGLDIEGMATEMISDTIGDGIEIPQELKNMMK